MKEIKILASEECIIQHKPLVYDFKIRKVKDTRRNVVSRRKIWKYSVKSDFSSYIKKHRNYSSKRCFCRRFLELSEKRFVVCYR